MIRVEVRVRVRFRVRIRDRVRVRVRVIFTALCYPAKIYQRCFLDSFLLSFASVDLVLSYTYKTDMNYSVRLECISGTLGGYNDSH